MSRTDLTVRFVILNESFAISHFRGDLNTLLVQNAQTPSSRQITWFQRCKTKMLGTL